MQITKAIPVRLEIGQVREDERPIYAIVQQDDYLLVKRLLINNPDLVLSTIEPVTGMNALHIAIGTNNLPMVKLLVEAGIPFIPDGQGRMPSLIAALCEVDEELQDYVLEQEAAKA